MTQFFRGRLLAGQVILGAAVYVVLLLVLRDEFVKKTVSEYLGRFLHRSVKD